MTFWWAVAGGVFAELVVFFGLRHTASADRPHWVRSAYYYVVASLMVVAGGVIALAHAASGTDLTPIVAMQVGASAPLFLRTARAAVGVREGSPDPAKID